MPLRPPLNIKPIDSKPLFSCLKVRLNENRLLNGNADEIIGKIDQVSDELEISDNILKLLDKNGSVDMDKIISFVSCQNFPPGKIREYVTTTVRVFVQECLVRH